MVTLKINNKKYGDIFFNIDDEDLEKVKRYKWYFVKKQNFGYIFTLLGKKYNKTLYLHRYLINANDGDIVDHIDRNGLNNTKSNLRIVTAKENSFNKTKHKNATSKYKGVSVHYKNNIKYIRARIVYKRKIINLGNFKTEIEAGLAYNTKAKELFGEYANLNNISVKKK